MKAWRRSSVRNTQKTDTSPRPRVVIVGGGFAGLAAAKGLAGQPVDVVIIDSNNFHCFQPLLYQVATAGLDEADISYPIRGTFRRQPNVELLVGRVTGVDLAARTISVADSPDLSYDFLVLACGAVSATFGVPGVVEHTVGLKNIGDALELRRLVLTSFEAAAHHAAAGHADPESLLSVAIVGGGPTGVELAGGLRELFDRVLARDFASIEAGRARITLIEGTDRLLGSFSPALSERASNELSSKGVDVELGVPVDHVERSSVVLRGGRRIEAGIIVWAAGVTANPLAATLGLPMAKGGRLEVGGDLGLAEHPEVFAVGDVAAARDRNGGVLPQVSQPAMQAGAYVAKVIAAQVQRDAPPKPFEYRDKGSAATIGRHSAVFQFPAGRTLRGPVGWFAWLGLHLFYLIGFRNRARVLVSWAWEYLTWDRGNRIVGADLEPRPSGTEVA